MSPRRRPGGGEQAALVFGLHAVEAVLARRAEAVLELYLAADRSDARGAAIRRLAEAAGITVIELERARLDEMADGAHQGAVARVRPREAGSERDLEDLLVRLSEPAFLLVLDGVTDPHNLGACLRTADGAGVHAVVAPRDRAAGLTPAARKVASGAAETVPFIQVTNLARCLRGLRDAGLWRVGTDAAAGRDLFDAELTGPLALVMGAEGRGLRRLTREHCDLLIRLPMLGGVGSLNVSVATGICLYWALAQRRSAA